MTLPLLRVTVVVESADRLTVDGTAVPTGAADELAERVVAEGCDGTEALVGATIVALHRHLGAVVRPVTVDVSTKIPRSVGLAGSSAIVIATLRALVAHHPEHGWARRLAADPALVATVALSAEREVLGIAAGPQDRVVQAVGGTVWMDFRTPPRDVARRPTWSYRALPKPPGRLIVACRPDAAGDSGTVHGAVDPLAPGFRAAMADLAGHAESAASAIERGDAEALGRSMDSTFDVRSSVMNLDPAHVAMVDVARAHGASANFTGSGGSIVASSTDPAVVRRLRADLVHELGCVIVPVP